jgi:hypothetical protein
MLLALKIVAALFVLALIAVVITAGLLHRLQ